MTVSILTPVYQAQAFFDQTVDTVLQQTHSDWQWVVVIDDGDDYAIPDDPRIKIVYAGIGSGPNKARNVGLEHCSGDSILPLDADDWMDPQRIEKLLPLTQQFGVAGDHEITRTLETRQIERQVFQPCRDVMMLSPKDYLDLNATIHLMFRRDVITRWPESVALAGDTVFNLDAIERAGQLAIHPDTLFEYRTHQNSHCHQADSIDKAERGYRRIIELIDQGEIAREGELSRHARALFEQKRATNQAYGQFLQTHGPASFDAFLERSNTL